jgi:hypothetical protein
MMWGPINFIYMCGLYLLKFFIAAAVCSAKQMWFRLQLTEPVTTIVYSALFCLKIVLVWSSMVLICQGEVEVASKIKARDIN